MQSLRSSGKKVSQFKGTVTEKMELQRAAMEQKLATTEGCHPKCQWNCDEPSCDQECEPICEPPSCSVRCQKIVAGDCDISCAPPKVRIKQKLTLE